VIGTLAFGEVEADVWQKLDRGVEQHGPLDAVRCEGRQFESEAAAERVADPLRVANAGGIEGLEHVVCMGRERPGWFPSGVAVPAQIGSQNAKVLCQPLFGEPAKTPPVRAHAVETDDRGRRGIPPLVEVELHQRTCSAGQAILTCGSLVSDGRRPV